MREDYDPLRSTVIGAASYGHQKLGRGLRESSSEQCRTYLRLSGLRTGLLLNFLVPVMKDGIRRMSM